MQSIKLKTTKRQVQTGKPVDSPKARRNNSNQCNKHKCNAEGGEKRQDELQKTDEPMSREAWEPGEL